MPPTFETQLSVTQHKYQLENKEITKQVSTVLIILLVPHPSHNFLFIGRHCRQWVWLSTLNGMIGHPGYSNLIYYLYLKNSWSTHKKEAGVTYRTLSIPTKQPTSFSSLPDTNSADIIISSQTHNLSLSPCPTHVSISTAHHIPISHCRLQHVNSVNSVNATNRTKGNRWYGEIILLEVGHWVVCPCTPRHVIFIEVGCS